MFKRVARRERNREKEEELGLDEDTKQVLGLQDTDSDESLDSSSGSEIDDHSGVDSDPGEEIDGDDADVMDHLHHKQQRPTQSLGWLSYSDGIHEESEDSAVGNEVDVDDDEDGPPMSVMAATTDPIYNLPNLPETQDFCGCIICPGKVIKNPKMAKMHQESSAHRRRLQRYTAEVSRRTSSGEGLNTDDPRDILRDLSRTVDFSAQVSTSKRSQRRVQWKDKQAERRKALKEKRRKMAMDKLKEMDHEEKSDAGGTTKKRVKLKDDGTKPGVSGDLAIAKSSRKTKSADGRHKESYRSGPTEPNFDDNQHARPKKKRQKRGPP